MDCYDTMWDKLLIDSDMHKYTPTKKYNNTRDTYVL